ncbi:MAG TPA: acyl-CoA dehydrogenase family protein [Solirubrobacteraceae bacterium]
MGALVETLRALGPWGGSGPRRHRLLGDAALAVLGPAATYAEPGGVVDVRRWQGVYLYSRAASIYGGTSQVQKNIIAERLLGLPRS